MPGMMLFAMGLGYSGAAQTPGRLQPASQWQLDNGNDSCAIFQSFSDGKNRHTLQFTPMPMSDGVRVLIELPDKYGKATLQDLKLNSGSSQVTKPVTSFRSARRGYRMYEFTLAGEEFRNVVASQRLAVDGWRYQLEMPVSGLDAGLAALGECNADRLARWGFGKDQQARLAQWPQPVEPFVNWHDYPVISIRLRQIGTVGAIVSVSQDGTASNCRIVRSSGHKELDQATCKVLTRAQFKAAIDRTGKPMASPYLSYIHWAWWR